MLLESLVVPLVLQAEKYQKDLEKMKKDTENTANSLKGKLSAIGDSMTKAGAIMTGAVTAPLVALGISSTEAASNLSESMNKANVVFGDSIGVIKEFASTSATSLGISEQAAYEATGTFGNLFTALGMTQGSAATMSMDVVTLASDLASFNNLDPTEALEKLRAGLLGESEPLKSMGVNLNAAMVEAKAMEMGLADASGQLSESALVMARYSLITEQTKNAQGDFKETSEGLANSQRIMKAEFENVKAQLGEALLPTLTELMKAMLPILKNVSEMSPEIRNLAVGFGVFLAAIGPVVTTVGGIIQAGTSLAGLFGASGPLAGAMGFLVSNPIGWLIGAIALLGVTIAVFGKDAANTLWMISEIIRITFMETIRRGFETLVDVFNWIGEAIKNVWNWLGELINRFSELVIPDWLKPGSPPPLYYALNDIGSAMKNLNQGVLPDFSTNLEFNGNVNPLQGNGIETGNSDLISAIQGSRTDERKLAKYLGEYLVKAMG